MSLELDNINEPNEETKGQELEQFGVWVKKSPQENQNDNSADFADAEKADVSSGFDDTFEIPSAVSSADGFENASFSDLSDFDIDNKAFSDEASGKNEDEDWNLDLSDFDIPDPPELSESDLQENNDQLPLESAMNEESFATSSSNSIADETSPAASETDNIEPAFDTAAESTESFEKTEPAAASETFEPSADSSSIDNFNGVLPSTATNDLDISDLSDFDFGDDSSFPVPDSITGQSFIKEETSEVNTPETAETFETPAESNVETVAENTFETPIQETPLESEIFQSPDDSLISSDTNDSFTKNEESFVSDNTQLPVENIPEPAEDKPKPLPNVSGYDDVSLDDLSGDVSELDISDDYSTHEPAESITEPETSDDKLSGEETFGDIEFEDITAAIPEEEKVIPKAEEIDEVAEAIFNNVEEEIDIDSFLNDSPAPTMGGTEEISLEDFMSDSDFSDASEFKEFISTTTTEKSDILNDPPIEMALSFDDSFALETEAKPEDDVETDIPVTQDFISDIVTAGEDTFDNFDDIFDNITDMNAPAEPEIKEEDVKPESNVEFDDVSEFDDLLNSFEEPTGTTDESIVVPASKPTKKVDFDIQVNLDDSEIKHETIETPDDSEEDVAVELFTDKGSANNTVTGGSFSSSEPTFSMADIDDSISFVDETPGAPASSIIDDLSFAGVEIVDISEKPAESNSAETNQEQLENTQEPMESTIQETTEPAASVGFEEESKGFDFPEIDDDLFEKAIAVGTESGESFDSNESIDSDESIVSGESISSDVEIPENEPKSEISFDELPDVDDIFDTAESSESLAETGIAAGVIGAGLATASALAEEDAPKNESSAPAEEAFVTEDIPASDDMPSLDDFSFTEEIPVAEETTSPEDEETALSPDELSAITNDIPVIEETASSDGDDFPMPEEAPAEDIEIPLTETPVETENAPVTEDFAMPDETPAAEETTVTEDFAMPDETPVAEETPVTEDFAIPEESPAVEETPVSDEMPSLDDFSFPEETPVAEETTSPEDEETALSPDELSAITNSIPVVEEEAPQDVDDFAIPAEESPAMEDFAPAEESSVAEETSVTEDAPAMEDFAMPEETSAVEETPVTEDFAIPEETPIAEETPITEETPVSDEIPSLDDFSFPEQTPVAEETTSPEDEETALSPDELSAITNSIPVVEEEAPQDVDDFAIPAEESTVIEESPAMEDFAPPEETPTAEEAPVAEETPVDSNIGLGALAAGAVVASSILVSDEETPVAEEPIQHEESVSEETEVSDQLNATNELDVVENCIYNDNQGDTEVISEMNEIDMNANESMDNVAENPVLDKIVNELSNLRNEMASIKAELDMLKNNEASGNSASNDVNLPETKEESTGFFSGDEDDETIALSGDELNNILNSADFTEESAEQVTQEDITEPAPEADEIKAEDLNPPVEETEEEVAPEETLPNDAISADDALTYDDGEGPDTSIDFNENVTEPVIDDINFDIDNEETQAPEELPDEIDIPSNEDSFVVDSSTSDFLEDNEPTLDEALSSDKVSYLNEDSSDNVTFEDNSESTEQSGFVPITQDELTSTFENAASNDEPEYDPSEEIDDTPAESVFESEQWVPEPESSAAETADSSSVPDEITAEPEPVPETQPNGETTASDVASMPDNLKNDVKSVLAYMDQLLENLPEEKIAEFARSEHFEVYKKLFTELGLA